MDLAGMDAVVADVTDQYEKPTVRMVSCPTAPLAVCVVRALFTDDDRQERLNRFDADSAIEKAVSLALEAAMERGVPLKAPKDCFRADGTFNARRFREDYLTQRYPWMEMVVSPDGTEDYVLTPSGSEALTMLDTASGDQMLFSAARVDVVIDGVMDLYSRLSGDRRRRRSELVRRVKAAQDELARFDADPLAGPITDADARAMVDHLGDTVSRMPVNMVRVGQAFRQGAQGRIEAMLAGEGTVGGNAMAYLDYERDFFTGDAEGSVYREAEELLSGPKRRQLDDYTQRLLATEFMRRPENADCRKTVQGLHRSMTAGIRDVNATCQSVRSRITNAASRHDAPGSGSMGRTLRDLELCLGALAQAGVGLNEEVFELGHGAPQVSSSRVGFASRAQGAPPMPMAEPESEPYDIAADQDAATRLALMRPASLADAARDLAEAIEATGGPVSLSEVHRARREAGSGRSVDLAALRAAAVMSGAAEADGGPWAVFVTDSPSGDEAAWAMRDAELGTAAAALLRAYQNEQRSKQKEAAHG